MLIFVFYILQLEFSLVCLLRESVLCVCVCIKADACLVTESLFNAFATAAFFKFVVFSIFEMRYLLAIWKANRPLNGENWDTTRRELSALYSRFCKYLSVVYKMS